MANLISILFILFMIGFISWIFYSDGKSQNKPPVDPLDKYIGLKKRK